MTTTICRDGSWRIELTRPLHVNNKQVDVITIQPADLSHVIRWGSGEIPSTLALAAELTGLPERALQTLAYPDVDRFFLALTSIMPEPIRADFSAGNKPLATNPDELPQAFVSDPEDPRYPKVSGPVRSAGPDALKPLFGLDNTPNPSPPTPPVDDMGEDMPNAMRAVGV